MRSELLSGEIEPGGKLRTTTPRKSRRQHALSRFLVSCTLLTPVAFAIMAAASSAAAQDATWLANPGSADFNSAANWTPAAVPTGTGFFGASGTTNLAFSADTDIGGWTFNAGASSYVITNVFKTINFTGAGIAVIGGSVTIVNDYDFMSGGITSLSFKNSSTAGSATISNRSGTGLQFRDTSTAGSATITNDGSFSFQEASTAGNAHITNNSSMAFADASTAGNAVITNNSSLNFISNATGGNSTITSSGASASVIFNNNATGGNATFTTNSGAIIVFRGASSGGQAQFITNVTAIFDIGNLSTAGMTAGSIAGSGTYALGARKLTVGGNNLSTMVSGVIKDGGFFGGTGASLAKEGTGTLTLSGTNTYTGATTVNGGTLSVNGSIATSSLTTVNAGGTLGGTGTVGNTAINGGALAPGNSIGTLTVNGNLVFTAASSYMIEVSPASADRTNVIGTANLGGAIVKASFAPGSYVAKQYTILNATGGLGGTTFGTLVNTNLPASVSSSLSYDASNAYLNLALNFAFPDGLNGNQANVGNALTNFFNTTGGIPLTFAALTPAGLTQVSGELGTGTQQTTFDAMNLFMGVMTDPFLAGRGTASPQGGATGFAATDEARGYAADAQSRSGDARDAYAAIYRKAPGPIPVVEGRWSGWATGFGGSQTTDGDPRVGSNTATSSVYGVAAGADYRFSPDTIAGFALGGGGTNFAIANNLGRGRSDLFQAGAFIRHTMGPAYLSGALAYGWQDVTTDRTVTIAGVDRLRARFDTNTLAGRIEGGYRIATSWIGLTPYAAGQATTIFLPNYSEQVVSGANTFALAYTSRDVTATRSELGLRGDKSYALDSAVLTLRSRAAWAHNFNPDRTINTAFQTLPGAAFVVGGAAQSHDAALTTASAELKWTNGWSTVATFEGEFSDRTRSYAGKGIVRYAW